MRHATGQHQGSIRRDGEARGCVRAATCLIFCNIAEDNYYAQSDRRSTNGLAAV